MKKNIFGELEESIQKMMEDFCKIGNQIKRSESLRTLLEILFWYGDRCIELSRHSEGNVEVVSIWLSNKKKNPDLKIPKYHWHDLHVSEIRFAVHDTNQSYKIALYKPTGKKDPYGYEYEFVGLKD